MSKANQRLETKGPSTALDRVNGAEHGIDRLRVGLALLHGQEARFELGQLFFAFLEECDLDRF